MRRIAAVSLVLALAVVALLAGPKFSRPPDLANVSYGPHERNVLDLWKARADRPAPLVIFIHGGGFRAGDKSALNPVLLDLCLDAGISVAAINYRLSQHAPYPAQMHDGARAVQFLRHNAGKWNLNPKLFGATGGSAGAAMSLWIGFHDDMAEPAGDDPVRRESTRLAAMAVQGAQTTLDPREIRKLIGEAAARHAALEPFYGLGSEELQTERAFRLFRDASPVTHLAAGDPPVLLLYGEPDVPLPPDARPGQGIHHPRFGLFLKERMDKLGIECELRYPGDGRGEIAGPKLLAGFLIRHLTRN
jgi:acetyl esterase/lipase